MKPAAHARSPARTARRRAGGAEAGYTLLLVLFIAALMLIGASVAVPRLIIQARRQKEARMIWRGQQYARAIGLYYRKTGHFPPNLEELEKGVAGVHFLRQAYKDPMNADDGSWRLIYLGPGGQLIGSFRWHTLAEYQAAQMGIQPSRPQAPAGSTSAKESGTTEGGTSSASAQAATGSGPSGQNQQQPIPLSNKVINEGDMVGGNLIGMASKINEKSVKVFMGADHYREWEFIWNPLQGTTTSPNPGTRSPFGLPTGAGTPPPTPSPAAPNPPQSPDPQGQR